MMYKNLTILLISISFKVCAQSSIGGFVEAGQEKLYTLSSDERYSSKYQFNRDVGVGLEYSRSIKGRDVLRTRVSWNQIDLSYAIEFIGLNSSFSNNGVHSIARYSGSVEYLWTLKTLSNLSLRLGPGLRFNFMDVKESMGEGFDTQLIDVVTQSGDTILFPSVVPWRYTERNPDALAPLYLQTTLSLQGMYQVLSELLLSASAEAVIGISPIINGNNLKMTSSKGVLFSFGLHYVL